MAGDGGNQNNGKSPTAYGAGGGGGGNYVAKKYSGANGADGRCIIYY